MNTLNLTANTLEEKTVLEHLIPQISDVLAEKINNGVYIEKDGKRLLNKKDLTTFMNYASEQAKKTIAESQRTGKQVVCVHGDQIMSWAIHYFEEDSIEGKLYNEDGSEYKAPKPVSTTTKISKPVKKAPPKPQMSIFDMMTENNVEESDSSSILPSQSQNSSKTEKQPSDFYQTYFKLVEKYEGSLILLRLGDFYEAMNDHATTLASELNLTLTSRDCGLDERVPIVVIPFHAIDNYVNKIVEHGYKVILAEKLDEVLEFKNIDEYEEPEELSEDQMRAFDSYVDEEPEELPTVSKIVGSSENDEDDEDCTEILNAESAKAFDSEALCIITELFDGEITLA